MNFTGGKSLLLQTVALFETLLFKIQSLKAENETLVAERAEIGKSAEAAAVAEARVIFLESELVKANEVREEIETQKRDRSKVTVLRLLRRLCVFSKMFLHDHDMQINVHRIGMVGECDEIMVFL